MSYRAAERLEPDPVTEVDVIVELMHRSTALRRRLLSLTLGAAIAGGAAGLALYGSLATQVYGRVGGAFFAASSIVTFMVVRRLCDAIAQGRERRWLAELAARHRLDPGPLAEAMGLFA